MMRMIDGGTSKHIRMRGQSAVYDISLPGASHVLHPSASNSTTHVPLGMSQIPQILFHSQLPTNKPRLMVRNSDGNFSFCNPF